MKYNIVIILKNIDKLTNFKVCKMVAKTYDGGSMLRKSVLHNNEQYMVKYMEKKTAFHYPSRPKTYFNSIFSEHIACNIGKKIGLNIQETKLGYDIKRNEYIPCVGCKDFCDNNERIVQINTIFNIVENNNNIDLKINDFLDTLKMIELQEFIDTKTFKKYFLDMFVFDAFIGNFDRNYKNWGIVYNTSNKSYKIAPIYDCASSLHPKTSRDRIENYLENIMDSEFLKEKALNIPESYFRDENDEKINYYNFLVEKEFNHDEDIAEAILRIAPKLVEIQENGYIGKLLDSLSELMGEDRAKVLKIELEYKTQYMFKEMIRIANKVLEKEKEQTNSWIKKEIDDDWER